VRFETVYNWQNNEGVVNSLANVDPDFLFNCDETDVNIKEESPEKLLAYKELNLASLLKIVKEVM